MNNVKDILEDIVAGAKIGVLTPHIIGGEAAYQSAVKKTERETSEPQRQVVEARTKEQKRRLGSLALGYATGIVGTIGVYVGLNELTDNHLIWVTPLAITNLSRFVYNCWTNPLSNAPDQRSE